MMIFRELLKIIRVILFLDFLLFTLFSICFLQDWRSWKNLLLICWVMCIRNCVKYQENWFQKLLRRHLLWWMRWLMRQIYFCRIWRQRQRRCLLLILTVKSIMFSRMTTIISKIEPNLSQLRPNRRKEQGVIKMLHWLMHKQQANLVRLQRQMWRTIVTNLRNKLKRCSLRSLGWESMITLGLSSKL